ncbi:MAG: signal peptidase I [Bdellovibrionales bacterium]|nr:signal peptidase I [Bdellovibrionales bacterium]
MSTDAGKKQADFVVRYALQSFGLILLIAVLVRIFFISSYVMSGSAMLPSVWPGDFLVATKMHMNEPVRGDVVILRCPGSKERVCLKRVVGIPGDRVEFKAGQLIVNGLPARSRELGSEFVQEKVGDASWAIWPGDKSLDSKDPIIVPPAYVYVLNDKRADEEDSRSWGPLPADLVEGRASRIWLSLDWFEKNGEVRAWPRVRWGRMLRGID